MEGKKAASTAPESANLVAINGLATGDKSERRACRDGGGGGGMDLSEENVDAFYKKMLVRAPNKRQVIVAAG